MRLCVRCACVCMKTKSEKKAPPKMAANLLSALYCTRNLHSCLHICVCRFSARVSLNMEYGRATHPVHFQLQFFVFLMQPSWLAPLATVVRSPKCQHITHGIRAENEWGQKRSNQMDLWTTVIIVVMWLKLQICVAHCGLSASIRPVLFSNSPAHVARCAVHIIWRNAYSWRGDVRRFIER